MVELVEQQLLVVRGSDVRGDIAAFDKDPGDLTIRPEIG
jgi:hypothetical protein